MVLLKEGLERVRDLVNTEITKAQAGTGTTLPSENDTGLESAVVSTKVSTTNTISSSPATLVVEQVIPTTGGNGSDLTEWELRINSDTESLNRTVTAPISKISTQQITRFVTLEITQN